MSQSITNNFRNLLVELEKVEAASLKVISLCVNLNLVGREKAYRVAERIDIDINAEEEILRNLMDVDESKLGQQASDNYQFQKNLKEEMRDVDRFKNREIDDAYMHQLSEASNDLQQILRWIRSSGVQNIDNIEDEHLTLIENIRKRLNKARKIHQNGNIEISIEVLENNLHPKKIRDDIKKGYKSELKRDLTIQEDIETDSIEEIFKLCREIQKNMFEAISQLLNNEDMINDIMDSASKNGVNIEELEALIDITKEKKGEIKGMNVIIEEIETDLEDIGP